MKHLKTTLILGTLTGILIALGYFVAGENGALMALLISAVMNFGSYWFSDKIVLSLYKAKEISEIDNPQIHQVVKELSEKAELPKPRIYLVNIPVPNAFATGRNKHNAVVAVSNAIMNTLNDEELRGVLAHEIAHIKNNDILISSIAATLAGAISYLTQMAFHSGDRENRNPILGLMTIILTPIVATLLNMAVSRGREYMADETGSHISKDPLSLANALRKIHDVSAQNKLSGSLRHQATSHLFIVNPFKTSMLQNLFSTHPPVEERVKRLKDIELKLNQK